MNTTVIIFLVVVVFVALAYFNYWHSHHFKIKEESIRPTVEKIFAEQGKTILRKKDFIRLVARSYSCGSKEALYILGLARSMSVVEEDGNKVKLVAA
ncbi:hypothetical protein L6467_03630 [Segatella bryantii]|uniref:hypothetical protein n=1 Tax=Segatella bryantii TaxID=77095 RepID=UPI001EDC5066|nr:hypothetical protein [Segatella bryantii]UKK72192.1 hypothetical protein L6467_03630 [Segatella bryantii]